MRPACDAGHSRPMVRPQHHPKRVRTRPPEPASGYTAQAERTATCAHVGPGPFGGLLAGGAGGDRQPACPALPGRAVVLLVILVGPLDTRCWPCSPGRPAGPGDCSGRDQAVQSVDELEESVSGCGDRPGRAGCGLDWHRPRRWLASGQVDRVADQERLGAREDVPPVGSLCAARFAPPVAGCAARHFHHCCSEPA